MKSDSIVYEKSVKLRINSEKWIVEEFIFLSKEFLYEKWFYCIREII